jgi:gamma-glutamylcyclotransferase
MTVLYFAYGSNMDKQRLRERVGNFNSECAAVLRDYELCFNKLASGSTKGKGYANVMASAGSMVEGILYGIDKEGITKLDRCEGCPVHYARKEKYVEIPTTGEVHLAQVYIATPEQLRDNLYPTKGYLDHLLAGERLLTPAYMEFLNSFPTL